MIFDTKTFVMGSLTGLTFGLGIADLVDKWTLANLRMVFINLTLLLHFTMVKSVKTFGKDVLS